MLFSSLWKWSHFRRILIMRYLPYRSWRTDRKQLMNERCGASWERNYVFISWLAVSKKKKKEKWWSVSLPEADNDRVEPSPTHCNSGDRLGRHLDVIKMWSTSAASASLRALTPAAESVRRCVSHDKDPLLVMSWSCLLFWREALVVDSYAWRIFDFCVQHSVPTQIQGQKWEFSCFSSGFLILLFYSILWDCFI